MVAVSTNSFGKPSTSISGSDAMLPRFHTGSPPASTNLGYPRIKTSFATNGKILGSSTAFRGTIFPIPLNRIGAHATSTFLPKAGCSNHSFCPSPSSRGCIQGRISFSSPRANQNFILFGLAPFFSSIFRPLTGLTSDKLCQLVTTYGRPPSFQKKHVPVLICRSLKYSSSFDVVNEGREMPIWIFL